MLYLPHLLEVNDGLQHLRTTRGKGLKLYVRTGISAVVMVIHAVMAAGTMCASAVSLTELKTKEIVSPLLPVDDNSRKRQQLKVAACKAQDACAAGTYQLKQKASNTISEIPRYKRGFVWDKSHPI